MNSVAECTKQQWTNKDGADFRAYLLTLSRGAEKAEWERRIVNTALPCIAVQSPDVSAIVKAIFRGNYASFLDLGLYSNYTEVAINMAIIGKIKDFDEMTRRLADYMPHADCWAATDSFKFKIDERNAQRFCDLSAQYLASSRTFYRRFGVIVLLKLAQFSRFSQGIFDVLDGLAGEKEYYVNMAAAWLLAEMVTKQRDAAFDYLAVCKTNSFIINKGISKCRDSFRITAQDKQELLRFKRKRGE